MLQRFMANSSQPSMHRSLTRLGLLPLLLVAGAAAAGDAEVVVSVDARVAADYKEGRHVLPYDMAGAKSARLLLTGAQAEIDGRLFAGPGIRLQPEGPGHGVEVEEWIPSLDGTAMTIMNWPGEITAGLHKVTAAGIGSDDSRYESAALAFTYDDDAPEISWGYVNEGRLGSTQEAESAGGERVPHGADAPPLLWTSAEDHWLPLAHRRWRFHAVKPFLMLHPHKGKRRWGVRDDGEGDRRYRDERQRRRRVSFEEARILVRCEKGVAVKIEGLGVSLDSGQALEIRASDISSRVEKMHFQVVTRTGVAGSPGATQLLVVEAIDAVGNTSRVEWPLEFSQSKR